MTPQLDRALRELGSELGYPRCCIDHFVAKYPGPWHVRNEPEAWDGTGFIPCVECRPLCMDELQFAVYVDIMIRPFRRCVTPFPGVVIQQSDLEVN